MANKELLALARSVLERQAGKRGSVWDSGGTSTELVRQKTDGLGTSTSAVNQQDNATVPSSHAMGRGTVGRSGNGETAPGTIAGQHPYSVAVSALRSECPQFVQFERWQAAINDAEFFLTAWAVEAARLGWTEADLFGLASVPERPASNYQRLSRYDQTGLDRDRHSFLPQAKKARSCVAAQPELERASWT
jgi:hypothetical protein